MGSEIIIALVGLFCTTVSSIVTFILTRRKYNTEVETQQISNIRDAFHLYKDTMEENLKSQKDSMEQIIQTQNSKIEALQKENEVLRGQINQLQGQMINFLMGSNLSDVKEKLMPLTDILKNTTK